MPEYTVMIDHEEGNPFADILSITGRVNNNQTAAVIKLSSLKGLSEAKAKTAKLMALAKAFAEHQVSVVAQPGGTVVQI